MSANPIIIEYLNSKLPLKEILQKNYQPSQYLESIFLKLFDFQDKPKIDKIVWDEIDKAISTGHPDSSVFILFLATCIEIANVHNNSQKTNAYIRIASNLDFEKIDPYLHSVYLLNIAGVKFNENKIEECKSLLYEAKSLISIKHPRYYTAYSFIIYLLGGIGHLLEFGQYSDIFQSFPEGKLSSTRCLESIVLNCIIIGNCDEGLKWLKILQRVCPVNRKFLTTHLENSFKILLGDFEESNYLDDAFKLYAKTCKCMSLGNSEVAQININKLEIQSLTNTAFLSHTMPKHLELCLGNTGKARLLLMEDAKKNKLHYLDDLFFGRLQLLENNLSGADLSFNRLIANVYKYGAMKRLLFELQFAKEMKISDILKLANGWNNVPTPTILSKPLKTAEITKERSKSINLIIGKSKLIQNIKKQIKIYASLKEIILITGETGTGKELVAKAIHDEGPNPQEPFLAINCAALTDTLLQSELFGYVAGAFTGAQKEKKGLFEAASKGTVFLDEFGDISPKLQVTLLRVLESSEIRMLGGKINRKIECKIVIATNVNLRNAVGMNIFREDLFFRLSKLEIKLPTLRERIEDLPGLIYYFLERNSVSAGIKKNISDALFNALSKYNWPGNIRELKNEIDRLYILNPEVILFDIYHFDFTHLKNFPVSKINPKLNIDDLGLFEKSGIEQDDPYIKIIQSGFPLEQRQATLKSLFVKYKKLTRKQIVEITKVGHTTATKDLQKLCQSGFIIRRSPTKSGRTDYFEVTT